jgi:hypothetical protein
MAGTDGEASDNIVFGGHDGLYATMNVGFVF